MAERPRQIGTLPPDAQLRLRTAAQVGGPGTLARRRAIDDAYRYIDRTYPEYLRADPAAES